MGTELVSHRVKEENMEIPSVPPGFESFTSFSLKRVEDKEVVSTCSASIITSESQTVQMESGFESSDDAKITRALRRRPWINYSRLDDSSGNESNSEQNLSVRLGLLKGVIRGCMECSNCQKEFKGTLKYIATIRHRAEKYGICRIVPPPSWKPPCPLKDKNTWETSKFSTRIQRVDKLQNRDSMKKILKTHNNKRKRRRFMKSGVDYGTGTGNILGCGVAGICEEIFGFEPGPEFTLDTFQNYANDFMVQYFRKYESDQNTNMTKIQEQGKPTVENIEGEYWRMVEKPTEEIEVLCGADLETGVFGSGFPKLYSQSGSVSDEECEIRLELE